MRKNIKGDHHVVIRPEHCINAQFMSNNDCPLARAIKEQKPTLGVVEVGGFSMDFPDLDISNVRFSHENWNWSKMRTLQAKEIDKVDIHFTI